MAPTVADCPLCLSCCCFFVAAACVKQWEVFVAASGRGRGHNCLPPDCNIIRPAAACRERRGLRTADCGLRTERHSDMRRSPNVFGDVRNIFLAYEQTQTDRRTESQTDRETDGQMNKKWKRGSVRPAMLQLVLAIVRRPQVEAPSLLRFIHSHCMVRWIVS